MFCRLLTLVYAVSLVAGCAALSPREGGFDACLPGRECTVEGRLSLHAGQPPAWIAHLESGDQCAKLALPDEFYEDEEQRKSWSGIRVVATGRAIAQPRFDESDGTATLWYEEGDRKIAMGMCDHGAVIYVEVMRASSGMTWTSP